MKNDSFIIRFRNPRGKDIHNCSTASRSAVGVGGPGVDFEVR